MTYQEVYQRSIADPTGFWGECAEELHWYRRWNQVLDDSNAPFYRWFVGGETNLCYNAVDRHALGERRGQAALIWESPEAGCSRTITYFELYREVNRLAGALRGIGVGKGDRVLIYMPMVPEAIIGMLACVRLGAIHSVVFGGFSVQSLATRIDDAAPVAVLTADAGLRKGNPVPLKDMLDEALRAAKVGSVRGVLVLNRGIAPCHMQPGRDLDWDEQAARGDRYVEPIPVASTDPSYILYTSGTTGKPKGVVRDTGGYMVALHASMSQIYDVGQGDVYWSTSDIGWVVGHSYIVYGPLLKGLPSVVFEGRPDYPDPGIWWRVIEKYGVTCVFTAPTALRGLRKFPDRWMKESDLSSLRHFFTAGEPLDEPTYQWASAALGLPVIDHYWQTESGWPMLTNSVGLEELPLKPGSGTIPFLGIVADVVDEQGHSKPPNEDGLLAIKTPWPAMMRTILHDPTRYVQQYWENAPAGMYTAGDSARKDADGYFWVIGRIDEVIKVSGYRLGTAEIESALVSHPAVSEAAIGLPHELKGTAIHTFAILKAGYDGTPALAEEFRNHVAREMGPIAKPEEVTFVASLPKTRSGKIRRRVLKAQALGQDVGDVSTLEA
jgi:propionyl-CoA synthetase